MQYTLENNIAVLNIDDGKVNVVGHHLLDFVNEGLDRAQKENAGAVILRGREGLFSAGFDLKEFQKGPEAGSALAKRGFEFLIRLYSYPLPVVAACTGHGIAMGAFILMASDTRICIEGGFKFSLPETSISMDLPPLLVALTESRVGKKDMTRVALQSEAYGPAEAAELGFLDEIVAADDFDDRIMAAAEKLATLPQKYYARNKLFIRRETLNAMQEALDSASK